MKKTYLIIMIMLFALSAYAESMQDVVTALNKINSYSADFIQKTEIDGFGSDTYTGKLYIKSRKQAMWDYIKPYRQFYLFDQKIMQYYDSDSKQLIRQKLDPSTNAFMRLMMNPADMRSDFNASYNSATGKLGITPLSKKSGLSPIVFTIKNGQITALSTKDQNGNNTTIIFSNIKIDPSIPDSVFTPDIPKGTQVFNQ